MQQQQGECKDSETTMTIHQDEYKDLETNETTRRGDGEDQKMTQKTPLPPELEADLAPEYAEIPESSLVAPDEEGRRLVVRESRFMAPGPDSQRIPLRVPNQKYALVNIAHLQQRPMSKNPGFRILGAFDTREEAIAHARINFGESEPTVYVVEMHELMVMCQSTDRQQDRAFNEAHINEVCNASLREIQENKDEFLENVRMKRTGTLSKDTSSSSSSSSSGASVVSSRVYLMNKRFAETTADAKITAPLSRAGMIANQDYAVVVIVDDDSREARKHLKPPEPLFSVLGVFKTEESANDYLKNTAAVTYPKCQITVIQMYEWGFPHNVDWESVPEHYADHTLDAIMKRRKIENNRATIYQDWLRENNIEGATQQFPGGGISVAPSQ